LARKDAERAFRFPLPLTLRYRSRGEAQWREGRVENISRSGVLFWTDDALDVNTRLEMSFVLQVGTTPPSVVCRGHVVRTVLPNGPRAVPGFAATISGYRFVRARGVI
jgi:hypothetical protein